MLTWALNRLTPAAKVNGDQQPMPGDFRLRKINGDVGQLIRIGQWLNGDGFADFEHAAVYLGGDAFAEAWTGGARISHDSDLVREDVCWSSGKFDLTMKQRAAIVAAALRYQGTGYSFLDYGALALHHFHIRLPGLRHYIANTGHMICSQLVDQCYLDAGVHLFDDGRWPGYVTPGDLYQLITQAAA